MKQLTQEDIDKQHSALGDSISLINSIIDGTSTHDLSDEDKRKTVERNVKHLEIMVTKDYWGERSLDASHATIAKGNLYLAGQQ
jgi:hypothetical protein